MSTLPPSFNEMQLEILKLFSREMSQEDLKAIKRLIVRYFAQKAIKGANQVWDNNAWTKEDETRLLDIHERTPYLSK